MNFLIFFKVTHKEKKKKFYIVTIIAQIIKLDNILIINNYSYFIFFIDCESFLHMIIIIITFKMLWIKKI